MKKKRILRIVILVLMLLAAALVILVFVKPKVQTARLKANLRDEDSLTATSSVEMADTDTIYSYAKALTDIGVRLPGTEGGTEAQNYIREMFEEAGLSDIEIVTSKTGLWQCDEWSFAVDGEEIDTYRMAHSFTEEEYGEFATAEGGVTAELVYVGDGSEKDFSKIDVEGKIVVADIEFTSIPYVGANLISYLYYDPENTLSITGAQINPYSTNTFPYNYYYAMENGAVGFVGILTDYFDSNEFNNEDYSWVGGAMSIPGYFVTNAVGEELKAKIEDDDTVSATITMSGSNTEVEAGAVVGFLPGQSDEVIMVHSHYDSDTTGGVEDASGSAALLAIMNYYAQIPEEERERTLMFVETDTHFSDYDTHDSLIEKYMGDDTDILVDVCVEHIAKEMKLTDGEGELTGYTDPRCFFVSDSDALIQITKEEVVRHDLDRSLVLAADALGDELPTDADSFYQVGIPVISMVSSPLYLYDNCDTLEMIDKEALRPTAEAFADIIWRLMSLDAEDF